MFKSEKVRKDFPIFGRKFGNKPLVYLDSAATSQKPEPVLVAMDEFLREHNANVHRGIYSLSEEATDLYEGARQKIANFINGKAEEIIFTRNATESINLVALSWARQNLHKGDIVVTTEMEHHSNIVPWQMLGTSIGVTLRFIPVDPTSGTLDLHDVAKILDGAKLVCISHMSNLLGTVNPIEDITKKAHDAGARVLIDACQSVPHMPVDVQKIGCDFLVFSGHKMLGPTGIGALWAKKALLESTEPVLGGGDMIKTVSLDEAIWNDIPWKFEAGTPNVVGAIGLGAAIDYLQSLGMENVWQHEQELSQYVLPKLREIPGVTVFGVQEPSPLRTAPANGFAVGDGGRAAIFSFWLDGMHPHDLASIMDEEGIAIRAGHMCAQPCLTRYGKPAAARASFYVYSTQADADAFLAAIVKAKNIFS